MAMIKRVICLNSCTGINLASFQLMIISQGIWVLTTGREFYETCYDWRW